MGRPKTQIPGVGTDIEDCEIICQDNSAEEKIIRREELSLLRRELSFISSDYRNILITFYIEDRKVNSSRLVPPKNPKHSKAATWLVLER